MANYVTDEDRKMFEEIGQWDAKIGLIYISSSLTMEREWHMALPNNVSFHTARISFDGCESTECAILNTMDSGQLEEAARKLGSAECDVIVFGCTGGTFLRGLDFDREVARRITEASGGVPAVTTSFSILKALKALGCTVVNAATPYVEELNVKERKFFADNGITVNNLQGFGVVADQDIARVTPEMYVNRLMGFDAEKPGEAFFISCTNSRSIEAINVLEKKTGKPVISSNQVALYGALTEIGYKKPIKGYGMLLEKYL